MMSSCSGKSPTPRNNNFSTISEFYVRLLFPLQSENPGTRNHQDRSAHLYAFAEQ